MKLILTCGYCGSAEFNENRGETFCSCCGEQMTAIYDYDIEELED